MFNTVGFQSYQPSFGRGPDGPEAQRRKIREADQEDRLFVRARNNAAEKQGLPKGTPAWDIPGGVRREHFGPKQESQDKT